MYSKILGMAYRNIKKVINCVDTELKKVKSVQQGMFMLVRVEKYKKVQRKVNKIRIVKLNLTRVNTAVVTNL